MNIRINIHACVNTDCCNITTTKGCESRLFTVCIVKIRPTVNTKRLKILFWETGRHVEFGFLRHNFGVDQFFCTKFGTVTDDEQPKVIKQVSENPTWRTAAILSWISSSSYNSVVHWDICTFETRELLTVLKCNKWNLKRSMFKCSRWNRSTTYLYIICVHQCDTVLSRPLPYSTYSLLSTRMVYVKSIRPTSSAFSFLLWAGGRAPSVTSTVIMMGRLQYTVSVSICHIVSFVRKFQYIQQMYICLLYTSPSPRD